MYRGKGQIPAEVKPWVLGGNLASAYGFLFFHTPQLSQDSPEQEASKSPRGGVPGSGEASLPEGNPQMSLQSPPSITSYSQVGRRGGRGSGGRWMDGCVGGWMNGWLGDWVVK